MTHNHHLIHVFSLKYIIYEIVIDLDYQSIYPSICHHLSTYHLSIYYLSNSIYLHFVKKQNLLDCFEKKEIYQFITQIVTDFNNIQKGRGKEIQTVFRKYESVGTQGLSEEATNHPSCLWQLKQIIFKSIPRASGSTIAR